MALDPRTLRWGGVAGLAFAGGVALQNGILLWGAPLPSAGAAEIEAFYTGNAARTAAAIAWVAINVPCLLVFVATCVGVAERAGGAVWGRVAMAGATALVALFAVATALQALLVARMPQLAQDLALLQLAWDLHTAAFAVVGVALGTLLGALALALRPTGILPRAAFAPALIAAALLLAGGAGAVSTVAGGPALWLTMAGFLGWLAFVAIASARLIGASRAAEAPVTGPVAGEA